MFEMFVEIKIDFDLCGNDVNQIDVVQFDVELVVIEDCGIEQLVSVCFYGLICELVNMLVVLFDEVWNLLKLGSQGWLFVGIQQINMY